MFVLEFQFNWWSTKASENFCVFRIFFSYSSTSFSPLTCWISGEMSVMCIFKYPYIIYLVAICVFETLRIAQPVDKRNMLNFIQMNRRVSTSKTENYTTKITQEKMHSWCTSKRNPSFLCVSSRLCDVVFALCFSVAFASNAPVLVVVFGSFGILQLIIWTVARLFGSTQEEEICTMLKNFNEQQKTEAERESGKAAKNRINWNTTTQMQKCHFTHVNRWAEIMYKNE